MSEDYEIERRIEAILERRSQEQLQQNTQSQTQETSSSTSSAALRGQQRKRRVARAGVDPAEMDRAALPQTGNREFQGDVGMNVQQPQRNIDPSAEVFEEVEENKEDLSSDEDAALHPTIREDLGDW